MQETALPYKYPLKKMTYLQLLTQIAHGKAPFAVVEQKVPPEKDPDSTNTLYGMATGTSLQLYCAYRAIESHLEDVRAVLDVEERKAFRDEQQLHMLAGDAVRHLLDATLKATLPNLPVVARVSFLDQAIFADDDNSLAGPLSDGYPDDHLMARIPSLILAALREEPLPQIEPALAAELMSYETHPVIATTSNKALIGLATLLIHVRFESHDRIKKLPHDYVTRAWIKSHSGVEIVRTITQMEWEDRLRNVLERIIVTIVRELVPEIPRGIQFYVDPHGGIHGKKEEEHSCAFCSGENGGVLGLALMLRQSSGGRTNQPTPEKSEATVAP